MKMRIDKYFSNAIFSMFVFQQILRISQNDFGRIFKQQLFLFVIIYIENCIMNIFNIYFFECI